MSLNFIKNYTTSPQFQFIYERMYYYYYYNIILLLAITHKKDDDKLRIANDGADFLVLIYYRVFIICIFKKINKLYIYTRQYCIIVLIK